MAILRATMEFGLPHMLITDSEAVVKEIKQEIGKGRTYLDTVVRRGLPKVIVFDLRLCGKK